MPFTDALQKQVQVGDIVNVPCIVTATGGTSSQPTVSLTTKYKGFDGNTDALSALDAIQVIKDE